MADPPPYAADDTRDGPGVERVLEATGGTPRWQQVVGIAGLLVVVWVGSEAYESVTGDFGGGGQGPGQHAPVENQDQEPETDDGGGHRPGPPPGGHG